MDPEAATHWAVVSVALDPWVIESVVSLPWALDPDSAIQPTLVFGISSHFATSQSVDLAFTG